MYSIGTYNVISPQPNDFIVSRRYNVAEQWSVTSGKRAKFTVTS